MSSAVELLFSVTVRVTLVVALAWGAAFLLRRKSAAIRHLVWSSAAIGALVLFAAAPFAPTVTTTRLPVWQNCTVRISPVHIELPSCGKQAPDAGSAEPVASGRGGERPAGPARAESAASPAPARPDAARGDRGTGSPAALVSGVLTRWGPNLPTVLVGIWAAGALVVLLTIVLERLWVRRLSGTSREAGERELLAEARELARGLGLPERVDVHLSREAVPPLSWGFWRPRILLPEHAAEWPEDQRRAILLHELGHARRRDVFTQTLAAVSCAVFWFNPLVWLAAARMREERERACDDLVLQSGVGSTSYAQCLLDVARRLSPSSGSRIALVGMSGGPDLAERVDRLVSRATPQKPPGRTTTFVSALAALAVLGTLAPHVIARPDCQALSPESRRAYSLLMTDLDRSSPAADAGTRRAGTRPGP